jgi:hypothetical protein
MENPTKIEIEGLKTIHKLCKFGADHNMEGCSFTEIIERMFDKLQQAQKVAVPEWINVNLLSPQIDTQVLICVDDDVAIAFYRDFDGEGYFEGYCSCKYWMPLPKAMIEAQEQNNA